MAMLNELQPDIRKMIELARKLENYDATLAAMRVAGTPIEESDASHAQRRQQEQQLMALQDKWGV